MADREQILGRLRQTQGDIAAPAMPRPHPVVTVALPREALIQRMTATHITVAELAHADDVPAWVHTYVQEHQLPPGLVGGAALAALPWQAAKLEFQQRAALVSDPLAISEALCGIAESGTALLQSGPANPTSLNFLPDHHIIVLDGQTIVGQWEEAWALCRKLWNGQLPRAINAISGPSSTADVGLTQVFGAHGPRNLAVLIIA